MSLFNIGLSGLNVAQNALTTTGHNFSNAATPGYTRQSTIIASAGGQFTGSGFFGQGSSTVTVQRVYDGFLTGQLRTATSASSELSTFSSQISQIDNLLADQNAGLAPLMQKFFAAVQTVSDTPGDTAARQGMLSAAQALTGQVKASSDYFKQLQDGINTQLTSSVRQVNDYTKQIASLNKQISQLTAASGGQPPNDLLDQRDQAVSELTKLVGAKVVVQDGNTYNVFVGNGQPLVMGSESYDMTAVPSAADPSRITIGYTLPNGNTVQSEDGSVTGGSIGGLLRFRSQSLDQAQNAIGRLSLAIGQVFNNQHKLGIDLNGATGTDLFSLGQPTTYANANNKSNAVATATITNAGSLTTSDYSLKFDGTNYSLTRLSDNTVVATSTSLSGISADGISVSLNGPMSANDSFLIQPTRNAAAGFGTLITDPAKVAAASPARADASTQNTGSGTAKLSGVAQGFTQLSGKITATYTARRLLFTDALGNVVTPTSTAANGTGTDYTFSGLTFISTARRRRATRSRCRATPARRLTTATPWRWPSCRPPRRSTARPASTTPMRRWSTRWAAMPSRQALLGVAGQHHHAGYVGAAVGVRREHGRRNGEPAQVPAALSGECEGHPDRQHDHRHASQHRLTGHVLH
jgi:flagellar hook-associated protein 1 FlgK